MQSGGLRITAEGTDQEEHKKTTIAKMMWEEADSCVDILAAGSPGV